MKYNDDSYAYVMLSEHARAVANQPDLKPGWQTREAWRTLAAATDQLVAAYRLVAKTYVEAFKQIGEAMVAAFTPTPAKTIPAPAALGVLRRAAAVNPPTTWKRPDRRGL